MVAAEKFIAALNAKSEQAILQKNFTEAINAYQKALDFTPTDAVDDLAVTHNQLGGIYFEVGDLDQVLYHSNQCIHYMELGNDLYGAGTIRRNVALALAKNGRLSDALLYARAALRNFEPYGQGAAEVIERTKGLIGQVEGLIAKGNK